MKAIYIYDEDYATLMALQTWKMFERMEFAGIIKWILEEPTITDVIHSNRRMNKK